MKAPSFRRTVSARLVAGLAATALSGLMAPEAANAEDEDMNTSAYLVFDPETGEFVTMHDPAMTGEAAAAPGADAAAPAERAALPPPLTPAVAAVVVLAAGGAFFWLRRKRARKP